MYIHHCCIIHHTHKTCSQITNYVSLYKYKPAGKHNVGTAFRFSFLVPGLVQLSSKCFEHITNDLRTCCPLSDFNFEFPVL